MAREDLIVLVVLLAAVLLAVADLARIGGDGELVPGPAREHLADFRPAP